MSMRSRSRSKQVMTVEQFRASFGTEPQCGEQLSLERWPEGFCCPRCGGPSRGYMEARRVHECAACGYQCSVTAGTIFHKTRTPLSGWFWAIYRISHDKKGISAVQLAKEIGVSYPTAWLILHKIGKAMNDRDQRYRLSGLVEVDEGYVGGKEHGEGRRGRGNKDLRTKSMVAVAVERRAAGKPGKKPVPGFAKLEVIPDAATATLEKFLTQNVRPGSHILSDGWHGYRRLKEKGFEHTATAISHQEEAAHDLFPWVHITLSNLKRFLLGTHHKIEQKHLKHYIAEFNYRLNRRTMETNLMTRLLRTCITTQTITYKQLIAMPEVS